MTDHGAHPSVVALPRRHGEAADRALPALVVAVEQVDREQLTPAAREFGDECPLGHEFVEARANEWRHDGHVLLRPCIVPTTFARFGGPGPQLRHASVLDEAGRDDVLTWWFGPGIGCKGSRLVPVGGANGSPAYGQYKPSEDGGYEPWALQVLELGDGGIEEFTFFLDTERIFPLFGLPSRLDG